MMKRIVERMLAPYGHEERMDIQKTPSLIHRCAHLQRYAVAGDLFNSVKRTNSYMRVLDVGCGLGYGSKTIQMMGDVIVVGLDTDENALRYAQCNYSGPDYIIADARYLPFQDKAFDGVTSFEVIEHVLNPRGGLHETNRVLKDQGMLFISTPNLRHLGNLVFHMVFKVPYIKASPYHVKEFTFKEFHDLVEAYGFNVERITGQILPFPGARFLAKLGFSSAIVNSGRLFPQLAAVILIQAKKHQDV